jgi:hypothetical protein
LERACCCCRETSELEFTFGTDQVRSIFEAGNAVDFRKNVATTSNNTTNNISNTTTTAATTMRQKMPRPVRLLPDDLTKAQIGVKRREICLVLWNGGSGSGSDGWRDSIVQSQLIIGPQRLDYAYGL